jgi:hypothetical protein
MRMIGFKVVVVIVATSRAGRFKNYLLNATTAILSSK